MTFPTIFLSSENGLNPAFKPTVSALGARKMKEKLWCDLKTPQEKAEYIRSGQAWEAGLLASSVVDDVAKAFEALAELEKVNEELEKIKEEMESEKTEYWL
jgi:hypothetical protein